MRTMRNPYFAFPFLLLAGACASTRSTDTKTIVEADVNYWTSYSSASSTLSKENCRVPGDKFHLPVSLAPETLTHIGETAQSAGFFSAASPSPKPRPGPEAVQITAPCVTSTLGITHRGKRNTISWPCNSVGGAIPPKEASAAYSALVAELQPYLSQLPHHQCRLR